MTETIKFKIPIVILSLLSLICTACGSITCFWRYKWYIVERYELVFVRPSFSSILLLLINIAPCVLLLLFLLIHPRHDATILYPITCSLITVAPVFSMAFGNTDMIIADCAVIIAFLLLTINATRGLNNKIYTVVAAFVGLITQLIYAMRACAPGEWEWYVSEEMYLVLFAIPMGIAGSVALYVALLVFGLNNRLPALIAASPKKIKVNTGKLSPESSLEFLKDKLDLGMITEEEYQEQRAKIISNL